MKKISNEELIDRAKFFAKHIVDTPFNAYIFFEDLSDEDMETVPSYGSLGLFDDVAGTITINSSLRYPSKRVEFLDTLLHELVHFKLWYIGHDYHDDDKEFIEACNSIKVGSNYDRSFDKNKKEWSLIYNEDDMMEYEKMYQEYVKKGE